MTNQARKHTIGLAGEFLVAGELLRRGISAAVTYGNAKKSDVIALKDERATTIEVKSTSEDKWVVGNRLPDDSSKLWVLVYLPRDGEEPPQYFVLRSAELRNLLLPEHEAYKQRYRTKHDKDFTGTGVVCIRRNVLAEHRAWHKVVAEIGA